MLNDPMRKSTRRPRLVYSESSAWFETRFDAAGKVVTLALSLTVVMCGLVPAPGFAQTPSASPQWLTLPEEPLFPSRSQGEVRPERDLSFPGLMRSIGSDFKSFPTQQNMLSLERQAVTLWTVSPTELSCSLARFGGAVIGARTAEDVGDAVVPLVAGVLVERPLRHAAGRLIGR